MSAPASLAGQLAAWNYFQSVKSPENDAFGLAIDQPDQGFGLEPVYSRERQAYRRPDLPLGVRRLCRADIQGLVIGSGEVQSRTM
jgi:Periplasmic binding protein domain